MEFRLQPESQVPVVRESFGANRSWFQGCSGDSCGLGPGGRAGAPRLRGASAEPGRARGPKSDQTEELPSCSKNETRTRPEASIVSSIPSIPSIPCIQKEHHERLHTQTHCILWKTSTNFKNPPFMGGPGYARKVCWSRGLVETAHFDNHLSSRLLLTFLNPRYNSSCHRVTC